MAIASWMLSLLLLVGGAWNLHRLRLQQRQLRLTREALLNAQKVNHHQQEAHDRDRAHWGQTEERLRSYLQLMDTLMNTIPNPIYFRDAEGRFQGCNNVFAKEIAGLSRNLIIGKHPRELPEPLATELTPVCQREERKMWEKGGVHTFETRLHGVDGQARDFLFSLAPLVGTHGVSQGSVAVLSDLTDKNRAAQHLLQREKLEGVLETAGAVCHELNQPLQALSGYTELLVMKLQHPETLPEIPKLTLQIERMRTITTKLQGITRYATKPYGERAKIIDIHRASDS